MADDERQCFFDECAREWDQMTGAERIAQMEAWCARLPIPDDALVLDVGCGTGVSSVACARSLSGRGCVVALDLSRHMAHEGRRSRPHPRVCRVCGDAASVPLPDASVHAVLAMHMWPHVREAERTLAEWRRVLKPGGSLWIVHLISRAQVNAIHRGASDAVREDALPPVRDLAGFLRAHGFCVRVEEEDDSHYLVHAARSATAATTARSPPDEP